MDFIFELLFQIVFELVGEALIEFGFHGSAKVLRSRTGRYTIAAGAGLGFGIWWGHQFSGFSHPDRPRLFWVSVALGAVAGLMALRAWRNSAKSIREERGVRAVLAPPWRWPLHRFIGFAVLNGAIAAGIAIGWSPLRLR